VTLSGGPGERPRRPERGSREREAQPGSSDRAALWALLALHVALEAVLIAAGWTLVKYLPAMQLSAAQKVMFQVGIAAAFVAFGLRALRLWRRLRKGGASTLP
jgi:hypothetical protein